jgi:hypothetical protein
VQNTPQQGKYPEESEGKLEMRENWPGPANAGVSADTPDRPVLT